NPGPLSVFPLFQLLGKKTLIIATDSRTGESIELSYSDWKPIGSGSFGVVYEAILSDSKEKVAIKKVLQDKRFKVLCQSSLNLVSFANYILKPFST
ncbi:Glycogen synthase kinase-3 beta, partial [Coelomomyces lativittatus]